jgi:hypothetical protein
MAWPSPEPVTLSLYTGAESVLELPVRPPREDGAPLTPFGPPETAPPLGIDQLRPSSSSRSTHYELTTGVFEQASLSDDGYWRRQDNGLEYASTGAARFRITEGDPLSAFMRCERTFSIARGDWQTRLEVWSEFTSDRDTFHLVSQCDAYAGDECVFSRKWTHEVPRKLV